MKRWIASMSIALCVGSAYAQDPNPETHWLSLINTTHENPTGMKVVVVPPIFFSQQAVLADTSWLGPNALMEFPGVRAALEAIDYWDYMLHDGPYQHVDGLSWNVLVLGADATPLDLLDASIVVYTAMVTDPLPFIVHFGIGLPTLPPELLLAGRPGESPQNLCTVINTGIGGDPGDQEPVRLRTLIVHEFGHCIGAGHTGTSLALPHQSREGVVYESHPTDVMSVVFGTERQCISNLNVQSLAEGYAFLPGPWAGHDAQTFMPKTDYATHCMPSALERF